jgi:outer membrane biosynthesis protein TonB
VDGNVTQEEENDEVEEEKKEDEEEEEEEEDKNEGEEEEEKKEGEEDEEEEEEEEEKKEDDEEEEEEKKKNDKPTQDKKKRAEKIDWRTVTLDLTTGDDAMMYKAAVQYMYSWLESRLINATKANKSASKRIHVIALDSDGEEVSTDEDDDEQQVSFICNIVCLELSS